MATSFVQASADNPLYASILALLAANGLEKVNFITKGQATAVRGVAAGYVVKDLFAKTGGAASKSNATSTVYDVPDIQAPRLPPKPPEQGLEIVIPPFRRGREPRPSPEALPSESPESSRRTLPSQLPEGSPLIADDSFKDPASTPSQDVPQARPTLDPVVPAALAAGAAGAAVATGVGTALGGPEDKIITGVPGGFA